MRPFLILAAFVVIGAVVWFLTQGGSGDQPVATTTEETDENGDPAADEADDTVVDEALDGVEEAITDVGEAVEGAVEEASDAVEDVVDDVVEGASEAVDAATDVVEDTVEDVTEGASNSTDSAITETTDAIEDTTDTAAESATDAVEGAADNGRNIAAALTPDGFDAAQLREFVAGSDLNALQKQAAEALISQAEENPEQIQAITDQLREALGL